MGKLVLGNSLSILAVFNQLIGFPDGEDNLVKLVFLVCRRVYCRQRRGYAGLSGAVLRLHVSHKLVEQLPTAGRLGGRTEAGAIALASIGRQRELGYQQDAPSRPPQGKLLATRQGFGAAAPFAPSPLAEHI